MSISLRDSSASSPVRNGRLRHIEGAARPAYGATLVITAVMSVSMTSCAPSPRPDPNRNAPPNSNSVPQPEFTLTIQVLGQGQTEPPAGTHQREANTSQSLRATPDANARFIRWSGDITGENLGHVVFMDSDKRVTAEFAERGEGLTVLRDVQPPGSGSIELVPAGGEYESGTPVQLRATGEPGCQFVGWEGDASGLNSVQSIIVDTDLTVIASFACTAPPDNNGAPIDECTIAADCDDSFFCNGAELCVGSECQAGQPPCLEGQACDETADMCLQPGFLAPGATVTSSIFPDDEQERWFFSGAMGQSITITGVRTAECGGFDIQMSLFGPGDNTPITTSTSGVISLQLPASGLFTLFVEDEGGLYSCSSDEPVPGGFSLSLF